MNCVHCGEPILQGETVSPERMPHLQDLHRECAIRLVIGSLGERYDKDLDDPPEMTIREAARLATLTFERELGKGQPAAVIFGSRR